MGRDRGRLLSEVHRDDVAVREIAYPQHSVLHEHRHERAYVSVVADGAYTELRDRLPRRCTPGLAIFHACGETHADYFAVTGTCVNFEFDVAAPSWRESLLRTVAAMHPAHVSAVRAALPNAADIAPVGPMPAWLRTVLAEFEWIEPVPLAGASRLAGLHPTHFVRAFRKHAGMTPGRYRRRERVRAASTLLLGSSASLSSIAHECGFADQSHLTNVFRDTAGLSPRNYREAFAR